MNGFEIVGLRPYSNDFNGTTYHGYTLHCTVNGFSEQKFAVGTGVSKINVKQEVFDAFAKGRNVTELLGLRFVAYYDQYKKVSMLQEVA